MNKTEEIQEMLKRWDSGDNIWSVEMGGIGPGYEQSIQVCMVEICREAIREVRPFCEKEEDYLEWFYEIRDKAVHRIDKDCGGFSGAQVQGASQIAYRFLRNGVEETLKEKEIQDRKILVSNFWPRVIP